MSAAIALALAAMVLHGLNDFVFKQAASRPFKTHQFIMVQSVAFGSLVWLYGYLTSALVLSPPVGWGMAAGLFMFTGFTCFAASLRHGSISINAPIFRLSFIVTALLAVALLAEPVTAAKLAGLALALLAIWLLLRAAEAGRAGDAHDRRRSLALVAVATVALGLGSLLHKIGLSHGVPPAMALAAHASVFLVLAVIVAVRADGRIVVPRAVWPYAAAGSTIGGAAFITMLEALARAEASIVVPISQMGFVVSAALGVLVLGEPLTRRKAWGLALAIAALWLLARS